MNDVTRPSKELPYELSDASLRAAAPIARSLFKSNGDPITMLLDEEQLTRVVAFVVDVTIKAAGVNWK